MYKKGNKTQPNERYNNKTQLNERYNKVTPMLSFALNFQ